MSTVSIKDGKNRFPELAREAEGGKEITVTRNGEPVCKIVPYKKKGGTNWAAGEKFLREHGVDRLVSWVSPDFDDPLPEDFLLRPLPPQRPITAPHGATKPARKKATGKNAASAGQSHPARHHKA